MDEEEMLIEARLELDDYQDSGDFEQDDTYTEDSNLE